MNREPETAAERRQAMPLTAAFVDLCRQAVGAEVVDAQLLVAQRAAREHAQVLASQGPEAARRWHRANAHRCTFFAREAGRVVGIASPWGQA